MVLMLRRKTKTCQVFVCDGQRLKSAPAPAAALIVIGCLLLLGSCRSALAAASAKTSMRSMLQSQGCPHPENVPDQHGDDQRLNIDRHGTPPPTPPDGGCLLRVHTLNKRLIFSNPRRVHLKITTRSTVDTASLNWPSCLTTNTSLPASCSTEVTPANPDRAVFTLRAQPHSHSMPLTSTLAVCPSSSNTRVCGLIQMFLSDGISPAFAFGLRDARRAA
jgi:hypothetical protein